MANPAGFLNTFSPQPGDGVSHPGFIPNGQPPQFNRPPVFPQKVAPPPRPPFSQQSTNQVASNGTSQQNSHPPSSLSSHSSRDPSPVPPRSGADALLNSSPKIIRSNQPPLHNQGTDHPQASEAPAMMNPPMLNSHQYMPPNSGFPKVGSMPNLGPTNSSVGHPRQTYVQNNTTQHAPNISQSSTMAASQPHLGPSRQQMPSNTLPPQVAPTSQSGPQAQQLPPSISNAPHQGINQHSSQAGLIRQQMPPNMSSSPLSSQFGQGGQQIPFSNTQMPLNSSQAAPSYQTGLTRPPMPPPSLNSQPGSNRQTPPVPQSGSSSHSMSHTLSSSTPTSSHQMASPTVAPPSQVYNSPNIPKSVLNLNNGARYPETSNVSSGMNSQPGVVSSTAPSPSSSLAGPKPNLAQNRYPPSPGGPQYNQANTIASFPPTTLTSNYPGMAPPTTRTNALGTLPHVLPSQSPLGPPHMPPSQPTLGPPHMPPSQPTLGPPHMPPSQVTFGPPHMPPQSQSSSVPNQRLPNTSFGQQNVPTMAPPAISNQSRMGPYQQPPAPVASFPPSTASMQGPPQSGSRFAQPVAPPGYGGPQQQPPPQQNEGAGSHLGKRYPQTPQSYPNQMPSSQEPPGLNQQMASMSVAQHGFQKLWGANSYDLLQNRNILPPEKVETPQVKLHQEFLDSVNCSPEIFRCTMTKIPETNSLLQKSRLPLGILIHPFKDLNHLAVIQCSSIVRCRACRTYINPFVYFVDHKRWKCNLCFRVNELPEEFQFDPVSKTYGDPTRRPEIKSATIEFIAPSEYMLRPPQPAVYLFLLDVSRLGVESGYLEMFCSTLIDELDKLPGDGRTQVGFITYDSAVHFYSLAEGLSQPQQMVVVDVDDIFLPCPDSLVVNLNENKDLIKDLLIQLPQKFSDSSDTHSALGSALQAAYKLMAPTGGRITVFQCCLPNFGPGALTAREDPALRAGKEAPHLNPATDFYKRLALDCSGQQIAVDLFIINSQYCDLATLSGISRFSGGCIHHIPLFKASNPQHTEKFQQSFQRYLSRKLGLEAVMRIRCSRGLSIHTFHGNFFVRSTDLLSLPNVNPDAGFGMQVSVEENLSDLQNVCFQAALLYTSTKGERRIRVHTMCLPVSANLSDILHSADQQCIIGLLAKMAVDRSQQSSLSDARDAFINVAIDVLSAYRLAQGSSGSSTLMAPHNLRLLPLYILALLKYVAFRTGQSTRLDDRLYAMCQMKTLPLANLIQEIYPDLYPIHNLEEQIEIDVEGSIIPQPPRLHLSSEKLETSGAFLLDAGDHMILFVGRNVDSTFCQTTLGVPSFAHISEDTRELPELETPESERLRRFVSYLHTEKAYPATLQIIRDDSQNRVKFYERLIEDRTESALSYYEFLQHLKSNVK